MCGICGMITSGNEDIVDLAKLMLSWEQHRGQESVGIAITNGTIFAVEKIKGLVDDFGQDEKDRLIMKLGSDAQAGIGHVRYGNTGGDIWQNYQPIIRSSKFGKIALVHNGNLVNTKKIADFLRSKSYDPDGTTDSELILLLIVYYTWKDGVNSLEDAIRLATRDLIGAFSLIIMTHDYMVGLRDPWGVRPLSFGALNGNGFVFASETCTFGPIGAKWICDLKAGEMIIADYKGHYKKKQLMSKICEYICLFEFIYVCSPKSVIHQRSLGTARRHMGEQLCYENPLQIDDPGEWVVGGVPNTGIPAALGYAAASGIEYRTIFIKNPIVKKRTFLEPNQRLRELGVRLKLQALEHEVGGKKVIVVEDSIVRGTNSRQLVRMLKEAGAVEVHMMITSPPYKYTCNLGTDTQDKTELIAAELSVDEIRETIGADSLYYLSLEGLIKAIQPIPGYGYCTGCFNRQYPIDLPGEQLILPTI